MYTNLISYLYRCDCSSSFLCSLYTRCSYRGVCRKILQAFISLITRSRTLSSKTVKKLPLLVSLRSKHFRAVSEKRTRNESQRPREKWANKTVGRTLVPFFARPKPKILFHVVPRSFFAPKPHGNACYAG